MPTISIFFGVIVQMYWSDHPPPHVHAFYAGFEALFAIDTGQVIGGSLSRKVERMVGEWTLAHRSDLMENWERGRRKQPFEKVPGADI